MRTFGEEIELTVDSGAAKTLCPQSVAANVPTSPGKKFKEGVHDTCAGGKRIPNWGEKRCLMSTEERGRLHGLTLQAAEVNRPLLSVSRCVDGGNRIAFDQESSYIEDKLTGERTTLQRKGGLYTMKSWVRAKTDEDIASGFPRQGGAK